MANLIYLVVAVLVLTWNAAADMPLGFYAALNNRGAFDSLYAVNYDAGAAVVEQYRDMEHLERVTEIRSLYQGPGSRPDERLQGAGTLQASISSNVIGRAHIAWISVDPVPDGHGRHAEYGRSVEDLAGVFSVEKFVQLHSNVTPGETGTDWMPCI